MFYFLSPKLETVRNTFLTQVHMYVLLGSNIEAYRRTPECQKSWMDKLMQFRTGGGGGGQIMPTALGCPSPKLFYIPTSLQDIELVLYIYMHARFVEVFEGPVSF